VVKLEILAKEEAILVVAEETLVVEDGLVAEEILVVEEMKKQIIGNKTWTYFTYGEVGHTRNRCPKLYDKPPKLVNSLM